MRSRTAVLALGSNLGSRAALLRASVALLAHRGRGALRVGARSALYRTAPVGPPQPAYLNAAVGVTLRANTSLRALLDAALGVEALLGRARAERFGARTIDLDVLWAHRATSDEPGLTVPHPRLRERLFALRPLCDVAPDARDPRDGARYRAVGAALASDDPHSAAGVERLGRFALRPSVRALEHTADEGFEVRALDRADALAGSAEALGALLVEPSSVAPSVVRAVEARVSDAASGAPSDAERLFAWLSEVLYALDAGRFALRCAVVLDDDARDGDGAVVVRGLLLGEPLDEARHATRGALKAVTWHELYAGPAPDAPHEFLARVIVDV